MTGKQHYQLDAIGLSKNVQARMTEFVTDDSFVRDPKLSAICRDIWGGPPELGGLISELWVEGAFPAKSVDAEGKTTTLDDLVAAGEFHPELRDQLHKRSVHVPPSPPRNRPLYLHQARAILEARKRTEAGNRPALVVTAGTGAGKTEAFLLPMLNDLYVTTPHDQQGVECLILYPMNALVNDQVERLYSWLQDQGKYPRCTLFHMTSETPEDTKAANKAKFPKFDSCRMRTRQEARGLETHGTDKFDGVKIEKLSDRSAQPRILITNYSMLEYMLCRPQDAPFFGTNLRTIVLDEAHLYTGTLAAEMTLLLRRLLARCDKRPEDVLQIATSATIGGGDEALKEFIGALFTKQQADVRLIVGENDHMTFLELEAPTNEPTPEEICTVNWLDSPTLTQSADDKTELIVDQEVCSNLKEPLRLLVSEKCITEATKTAKGRPAVLLYESLRRAPLMKKAEDFLWLLREERGVALSTIAIHLFGAKNDPTLRATTRLLQLGAAAREQPYEYPVLPHRLHLLARTTAGLSVCLNSECSGNQKHKLYGFGCVSEGVRERCPDCLSASVTLVRCNHCGEWALGGITDSDRLRPIAEQWYDGQMPTKLKIYSKTAVSGAHIHWLNADGRFSTSGVPVWEAKTCANCGEHDKWVPFITYDPYALSTLAESVLSELPLYPTKAHNYLPAQGRRLLTFSDSRLEAARLGPRMTRSHELQVFRAALARELAKSEIDSDLIAYFQGEISSGQAKLDKQGLPDSVKETIRKEIESYNDKLAAVKFGKTIEEWGVALKSSPLIKQLMDEEFSESDEAILWALQAQNCYDKNALHAGIGLHIRITGELARPARNQVSLETLGLVEVVYPRLDELEPPIKLMEETHDADALTHLRANWTPFLALLCDDLRAKGCVTVNSEKPSKAEADEDAQYQFGEYLIGNWCALEQINEYTRLARFVSKSPGGQKMQTRHQFTVEFLQKCGLTEPHAENAAPHILTLAYYQLLEASGWDYERNCEREGVLRWLERGERQLPRDSGGKSVEAIRIRLAHVAIRHPDTLYECKKTSYIWTRQVLGCAPEKGCRTLSAISREHADASPRYGRLRQELLNSPVFEQGLWAEEHSAQLNPKENRRLQDLFKAGARNILSSTTTLELGIDIGGLNAVLMGNMPPGKANYLQRAGRAGRRADGSSVVATFVRSRPFDREVFRRFGDYLKRELRPPTIALDRDRIGRRHFHAWLLNEYFRIIYPPFTHVGAMRAFGDMGAFCGRVYPDKWSGTQKPTLHAFAKDWNKPQGAVWWSERPQGSGLEQQFVAYLKWLKVDGNTMERTAGQLFADAAFFEERESWIQLVEETVTRFQNCINDWTVDYDSMLETWSNIPAQSDERSKANALRYQLELMHGLTVIEALGDRQFLPRYGFPIGVLKLKVIAADDENKGRVREEDQFRLERPGLLALREYVPGTQLLAGGKLITSRGLLKHWSGDTPDKAFGLQELSAKCQEGHTYYSRQGKLANCPICGAERAGNEEKLLFPKHGFMSAASEPPRRSTNVEKVGNADLATITFHQNGKQDPPLEPNVAGIQGLNAYYAQGGEILVFNKGNNGTGFAICTMCGYADSEREMKKGTALPAGFDKHPPLRSANEKSQCLRRSQNMATPLRNQILAAREITDVLMLDFSEKYGYKAKAKDPELMLTLARALQAAGAKILGLDEREIGVMTVPTGEGGACLGAVLYDNAPGGAGHVREMLRQGKIWLEQARELLYVNERHHAQCETACLDCLLNFSAQFDSSHFKRRETIELLDDLLNDSHGEEEFIAVPPDSIEDDSEERSLRDERQSRRQRQA